MPTIAGAASSLQDGIVLGAAAIDDGRASDVLDNLVRASNVAEEAATAFEDPNAAFYPELLHPNRFILIGYSKRERLLYVVYAEVRVDEIRIISARKTTRHEKKHYEED